MSTATGRRAKRSALSALAAAATLGSALIGATPASAAGGTDALWLADPYDVRLSIEPGAYQELSYGLYHDNASYRVVNGVISLDLSELAGVAEVTLSDNCFLSDSGTAATCDVYEVGVDPAHQVTVGLRTLDGVTAGGEVSIGYSGFAETSGPGGVLYADSGRTPIALGPVNAPDLGLPEPEPVGPVAPGTVLDVPAVVTNHGGVRAEGFRLQAWSTYGLDLAAVPPGCDWTPPAVGGEVAPLGHLDCTFDTVVEPGATVEIPEPLRFTATSHGLRDRVDVNVRPLGDVEDGKSENNYAVHQFTVDNQADLAVLGDRVHAAAGARVTATVTFVDQGPGWFANMGSGEAVGTIGVAVPPGTTVVSVPEGCRAWGSAYICELPYWVLPGHPIAFPFGLRVDRVVPDATGAITLQTLPHVSAYDPAPENGRAQLVINPSA
jgi:hypothetical protein